MANTRSAKKMVRKIARRTERHVARRSRMRRFALRAEQSLSAEGGAAAGDKKSAARKKAEPQQTPQEAFRAAQSELMRAAHKGAINTRTAARKVGRLARRLHKSGARTDVQSGAQSGA